MEKLKTRLPGLFHAAAPGLPASDDGTSASVVEVLLGGS
jgi:hypothetical protein